MPVGYNEEDTLKTILNKVRKWTMVNNSTDSVDTRKWPIVVATGDLGQVSWTPHNGDITEEDRPLLLGEGWLFGEPEMKRKVMDLLDNTEVDSVLIDGWAHYRFTESRRHPHDIVVAMHRILHGRGTLNERGYRLLGEAVPALVAPENNDPNVIY